MNDSREEKMWADEYLTQWNECDLKGKIKTVSLLESLLETAGNHAEKNKFGFDILGDMQQTWVLVMLFVKIEKYPKWREKYYVETWPKKMEGYFAYRDFMIKNEQGEILGSGSSTWLIINTKTRRPAKLDLMKDKKDLCRNISATGRDAKRLALPENGINIEHKVQFSDLDINGHVYSAKYLQWTIDAVPFEVSSEKFIKEFEINFLSEGKPKDLIQITYNEQNSQYSFVGKSHESKKNIFALSIKYE
jgi:acyl-ACP thioesterase